MVIAPQPARGFAPAWWLPDPHSQTLWGKFCRRTPLPSTGFLERWDTPDGDFLDLFRVPAPPGAPRLLVLHGLEGTIRSHYARGILGRAAAAGWAADLLIFRGCGDEPNRAPRFYHSGETGDLGFVVDRISAEQPGSPLFMVGYSLGGNVLLKWLGEAGVQLPGHVRAAAAVSVPFDLEAGASYLGRGFSRIYERHFLHTLKRKAMEKLNRFPGLFDAEALRGVTSIVGFDEVVTAPIHGFADAHDYYQRSSALRFLPNISLPTMLLSAFDDPFLPPAILREAAAVAGRNPHLTTVFSARGGHVGFVGASGSLRPRYFSEDRIVDFFREFLEPTRGTRYDGG